MPRRDADHARYPLIGVNDTTEVPHALEREDNLIGDVYKPVWATRNQQVRA